MKDAGIGHVLRELTPEQQKALRAQGFPAEAVRAFRLTAETLDWIVISRPPGAAAAQLIEDRHDLKGFFLKAKSCNWGPMAGFICHLPPLNKKGTAGTAMADNLVANVHTVHKYAEDPNLRWTRTTTVAERKVDVVMTTEPWVPLTISQAAMHRLEQDEDAAGVDIRFGSPPPEQGNDGRMVGVAVNEDHTVLLEYVLVPAVGREAPTGATTTWWRVFHRQIFHCEAGTKKGTPTTPMTPYLLGTDDEAGVAGAWMPVEPPPVPPGSPKEVADCWAEFSMPMDDVLELTAAEARSLDRQVQATARALRLDVQIGSSAIDPHVAYRLRGAQNPFPPYRRDGGGPGDPRNAVAGDYDLFAMWPRLPDDDGFTRPSERGLIRGPAGQSIFRQYSRSTLEIVKAPQVHVEVIPRPEEMKSYEDSTVGNISPAVENAIVLLNALITAVSLDVAPAPVAGPARADGSPPGSRDTDLPVDVATRPPTPTATVPGGVEQPNAAFHSDEGGRPDITNTDLPLVAFGPNQALPVILRTHRDLLRYIDQQRRPTNVGTTGALKDHRRGFQVVPHFVWLLDLVHHVTEPVAADAAGVVDGPHARQADARERLIALLGGEAVTGEARDRRLAAVEPELARLEAIWQQLFGSGARQPFQELPPQAPPLLTPGRVLEPAAEQLTRAMLGL